MGRTNYGSAVKKSLSVVGTKSLKVSEKSTDCTTKTVLPIQWLVLLSFIKDEYPLSP